MTLEMYLELGDMSQSFSEKRVFCHRSLTLHPVDSCHHMSSFCPPPPSSDDVKSCIIFGGCIIKHFERQRCSENFFLGVERGKKDLSGDFRGRDFSFAGQCRVG